MNKLLLGCVAVSASVIAGPAFTADMPLGPPIVPIAPPFTWSSCYLGGHVGGASAHTSITDPVQLAQDTIIAPGTTVGVTTANTTPVGVVIGGQIGCDYQFSPHWVVGIEGAASGTNMKGSTTVGLPAGFPGDFAQVTAQTDFIPSLTMRLGYSIDRLLLYAKGGAAWASDKYDVTGTLTGLGFGFQGLDLRTGWTAGAGVEWAFGGSWSVSIEYDYYQFGQRNVLMSDAINAFSGMVETKQSAQIVKAGLNFHVWSYDW
jgi:outer membrane immunogenic protein